MGTFPIADNVKPFIGNGINEIQQIDSRSNG